MIPQLSTYFHTHPSTHRKDSFTLVELLIVTPLRFLRKLRRGTSALSSYVSKQHFVHAFTLVELLIVIGILAILLGAVITIINPSERLKESRDSTRIQELTSLEKTIQLLLTQNPDISLGTSRTVYISIPDDASSTCGSLSLPSLPSGYVYSCKTTQNLRNTNGTGWLPINFQSAPICNIPTLPLDPTNTTSSGLYYRYIPGGSFHLEAVLESTKHIATAQSDGGSAPIAFETGSNKTLMPAIFPTGYSKVPGNSSFGTSDFYVMQYEAKCDYNNDNVGDTTYDTSYHTWPNNSYPCTGTGHSIISSSAGYPLANISQTTAASYCSSTGAHLITNNEWQTIAHNIQNNSINWSGGSVGSGYIPRGNSNNTVALEGSTILGGINNRKHTLSNNSEIYDLAGNVYEWTNDTILGTNKPVGTAGSWAEFTAVSSYGTLSREQFGPLNSSYSSTQGIGQYYMGNADASTYAFLRGGNWGNGMNAGVEALLLYATSGYTSSSGGFRCAR